TSAPCESQGLGSLLLPVRSGGRRERPTPPTPRTVTAAGRGRAPLVVRTAQGAGAACKVDRGARHGEPAALGGATGRGSSCRGSRAGSGLAGECVRLVRR